MELNEEDFQKLMDIAELSAMHIINNMKEEDPTYFDAEGMQCHIEYFMDQSCALDIGGWGDSIRETLCMLESYAKEEICDHFKYCLEEKYKERFED
jgi:hypothetical protein